MNEGSAFIKVTPESRAWCQVPIIPALGKLRQEGWESVGQPGLHGEFQASLS
jgi:hypothetical protein